MFEIDWDGGDGDNCDASPTFSMLSSGERVVKTIRVEVESMVESHFGDVMDDLFQRYGEMVGNHLAKIRAEYIDMVISLRVIQLNGSTKGEPMCLPKESPWASSQ